MDISNSNDIANSNLLPGEPDRTTTDRYSISLKSNLYDLIIASGQVKNVQGLLMQEGYPDGRSAEVNRRSTIPLSLIGSDSGTLRFSTQGIDVGNGGNTWLWTRGQYSILTGAQSRSGYAANVQVGIVRALGNNKDLGFYGSFTKGETTITGPNTTVDTEAFGLGTYLNFDLQNGYFGGISAYFERSDNSSNVSGTTATFDRDYMSIDAELSRAMTSGSRAIA